MDCNADILDLETPGVAGVEGNVIEREAFLSSFLEQFNSARRQIVTAKTDLRELKLMATSIYVLQLSSITLFGGLVLSLDSLNVKFIREFQGFLANFSVHSRNWKGIASN